MALMRFIRDLGELLTDTPAGRQQMASAMRAAVLSDFGTSEVYGVRVDDTLSLSPDELMPPPAEVQWGPQFFEKTCEDMRRNVLEYGALIEGALDLVEHLPLEWMAGVPGDRESEGARDAIAAAFEAFDEHAIATRGLGAADERGFSGAENIWGVVTRGKARDLVCPIEIIPRPTTWFGFDYRGRALFRRDAASRGIQDLPVVPEFKVTFMRCGDLHTRYGRGKAIDCYPNVWAIDANMKRIAKLTERFGYPPMVVTYPNEWPEVGAAYLRLYASIKRQWKNFILVPGEVTRPEFKIEGTEATFAAANATVQSLLSDTRERIQWLADYIQGTKYSSANQQQGSFARDQVASTDRMFKAPSYAACKEAALNRGFVAPVMMINYPTMDREKWPRATIDSSFGEDLRMFMELCESGAKQGVRISTVTWSERTGIPLASDDDESVLTPSSVPAFGAVAQTPQAFSEPRVCVMTRYGMAEFPPDYPLEVEGRGEPVRASKLMPGMRIVTDPKRLRLVAG